MDIIVSMIRRSHLPQSVVLITCNPLITSSGFFLIVHVYADGAVMIFPSERLLWAFSLATTKRTSVLHHFMTAGFCALPL